MQTTQKTRFKQTKNITKYKLKHKGEKMKTNPTKAQVKSKGAKLRS